MRLRPVIGNLGTVLKLFSFTFLAPIPIAFAYEDADRVIQGVGVPDNALLFASAFLGTLIAGLLLERVGSRAEFHDREGYAIVGLAWFVLASVAAIPFLVSGVIKSPTAAFFEGMSGLTTTGMSTLPAPELLPKSILFWRSFIQFVGGGGIIVLMVAVLSKLASGALRLMRAEVSGGSVTRLRPKIAATAKILWGVYVSLNVALIAILTAILHFRHDVPLGDALFEGALYGMPAIATGGFAPTGAGAAAYSDWLFELALMAGMIAGALSFSLLFLATQGRIRDLFRDPEFRFFALVTAATTVLITAILVGQASTHYDSYTPAWTAMGMVEGDDQGENAVTALRYAAFQTVSFGTTTGYASVDFEGWPHAALIPLILLYFAGGMYGSTSGGPKAFRLLIAAKVVWREVMLMVRPRAQVSVRIRGNVVPEEVIRGVMAFFAAYFAVFVLGTIVVSAFGYDLETSASASGAALSSAGVGIGEAGPTDNFSGWPPALQIVLSVLMWFGRLEIFAALVLFFPAAYTR